MNQIEHQMEEFLLNLPGDGWVKGAVLCAQFGVSERQLRKVGESAGLVTEFTISGNKGFKHIVRASLGEWEA